MGNLIVIAQLSNFQLETQRLKIRVVGKADLGAIHQIHRDEQVNRYLPYQTWVQWEDARAWYARVLLRRRQEVAEQFVIIAKQDQSLVGTCLVFIHEADPSNLELGYVLAKQHWGKGFMFEALSEFVPRLSEQLSLKKMYAVIESENKMSRKLISKLNFMETHRQQQDRIVLVYYVKHVAIA